MMKSKYIFPKMLFSTMLLAFFSAILNTVFAHNVLAATLQVGPSRTFKMPSEAAVVARNGDIIEIDAGLYQGDVATWTANNLTIKGVGGKAHLDLTGITISNKKAIWVIQGENTTVESIEFSGASVPDRNGAGIRQEGNNLTVKNCSFHHNENGILESNKPESSILIEYSEFAYNGYGDGYSHNMYIGRVKKFTLRYSYSHHVTTGHLVKSRARENNILYNCLSDEATGTSSYVLDLPEGGRSYIIGNIFHQGENAQNSIVLSYAAENTSAPLQELYVSGNTFVNDKSNGKAIRMVGAPTIKIVNNIFEGFSTTVQGIYQGEFTNNIESNNFMFADRDNFDYHLTENSPAINKGINPGTAGGISLIPKYEYDHPANSTPRQFVDQLDVGAYEYTPQTPITYTLDASAGASGKLSPTGSIIVEEGSALSFHITPDAGYQVKDVLVDGHSQGPITSYIFSNIQANHTIEASFKAITSSFFGFDEFGGTWHDAELVRGDNLAWAAVAANILAWTGWGTPIYDTAQKITGNFETHWTQDPGLMEYGWRWWLTGYEPTTTENTAQVTISGGAYWPEYNFFNYFHENWANFSEGMWSHGEQLLPIIDDYLRSGYGVTVALYGEETKALTVWGYEYDTDGNYTGLWITDAIDPLHDMILLSVKLRDGLWYVDVENHYGYQDWFIRGVQALEQRPPESQQPIPEPGTFFLMGLGLLLGGCGYKRNHSSEQF